MTVGKIRFVKQPPNFADIIIIPSTGRTIFTKMDFVERIREVFLGPLDADLHPISTIPPNKLPMMFKAWGDTEERVHEF